MLRANLVFETLEVMAGSARRRTGRDNAALEEAEDPINEDYHREFEHGPRFVVGWEDLSTVWARRSLVARRWGRQTRTESIDLAFLQIKVAWP